MVSDSTLVTIIIQALSAYAITFVVTASSLFEPFRMWFIRKTPRLRIRNNNHLIECRMCFGLYASLLVCLITLDFANILPVYGLSYFICTQEK